MTRSLSVRLQLVVLLALLPALTFLVYSEHEARQQRERMVQDQAERLMQVLTVQQRLITDGAEQTLDVISAAPAVREKLTTLCQRLLAGLLHGSPRYLDAAVFGLDGHPVCAPGETDSSLDVSDRTFFRQALKTGGFVIGDYTAGRTGGRPAIDMAKPLLDRDGTAVAVVDVALSVDWLRAQFAHSPLPPGSYGMVADRSGTLLARNPDVAQLVGRALPAEDRFILAGAEDRVVSRGDARDGNQLVEAYSPLDVDPKGLAVAVVLNPSVAFVPLMRANRNGLWLIISGAMLGLTVTYLASRPLIRQPFGRLLATAERLRDGDLSARTGIRADTSEFGRLGATFDAMAAEMERRRLALRDSEARFQLLADNMSQLAWITDASGWTTWFNQRWYDYTGTTLPAMQGWGWKSVHHPDHIERDVAEMRNAFASGEPYEDTILLRGCDGCYRWFLSRALPVRDEQCRIVGWFGTNTDVTEQRRVVGALGRATALLTAIGQCSPDPIFAKDHEGRYLFANPACLAILGKSEEQVLGHTDIELFGESDQIGAAVAIDRRVVESGDVERVEEIFDAPEGGARVFQSAKAPLRTDDGRAIGMVGVSTDITQMKAVEAQLRHLTEDLEARVQQEVEARKAAQTQLAQAQKMQAIGQLAGGIAHDFNNILQAVSGAATLMELRATDARVLRLTSVLLSASARGANITSRLLAFSRQSVLKSEPLDIAHVLDSIREVLSHTLDSAIAVFTACEPGVPPLLADRGQLETALVNLGTNARDAMPDGGRLEFSATAETVADGDRHPAGLTAGDYVRISVRDTGGGMDAATLARASEPFFTTKPQDRGTGLGLSMVRGFAEQSGGGFFLLSAPDRGTTVQLWLPQAGICEDAPPMDAGPPDERQARNERRDGGNRRVLFVDDDQSVRETVAGQLEERGYLVQTATCGQEALDLLDAGTPVDVLVTDLSMPGINGLGTIREAHRRRPGLPALLLTGYAGDRAALAADAGSFTMLRKPMRGETLIRSIEAALARKPA